VTEEAEVQRICFSWLETPQLSKLEPLRSGYSNVSWKR